MRLLSQRDLRRVLASIQELYCWEDPDLLALRILALALKLVPATGASFNRLELEPLHLLCQPYPKETLEPLTAQSRRMFLDFEKEHPFVVHYRRTGGFPPLRTTDLVNARRFQRSAIYNEYYRRFNSRFQIEFTLPSDRNVCLVVALDRSDKNFSERDRAVLTLFHPHVAAVHRTAQKHLECKALEQCIDPGRGVALLSPTGRVRYLSPSAPALFAKYFRAASAGKLPEEIYRWLNYRRAVLERNDCSGPPLQPLVVECGFRRLEVEMQPQEDGARLLLNERRARLSPARLTALGLTARQAEVLYWITQGKTNPEIAIILGASPHTINRHVHAILTKLGVESRASAMLRALELFGPFIPSRLAQR